jgi:hypothetical protein
MKGRTPVFAAEGQQPIVAALAAAQPQEAAGEEAALEKGIELVLDEPRQFGAGAGLGVRDEAGCVLLHQALQRGLLRSVALVVDGAQSSARWGCRPIACARGSRGGEPARSQAARCYSIAQSAAPH